MHIVVVKPQLFNPLPTNDAIWRHETFSFMVSHPAMSLGDRLCVSRKGGTGGGGWVHPKGANSMAASGLSFWLEPGRRFCGTGGGGWVHPKGANSMAASGLSFWLEPGRRF